MGANAQTAVPVFTAGQVLTAQQQTEINTGVPVFATTVTRDAAFGGAGEKTLAEGQFAYIEATNTTQYYDGAAWQSLVTASGVVQVKNAFKSDTFTTTSTSYVDITGLSISITPTSASNKILVFATVNGAAPAGVGNATLQLMRDATAIGNGDAAGTRSVGIANYVNQSGYAENAGIGFLDSPATTSATTYKIQVKLQNGVGTVVINRSGTDTNDVSFARVSSQITVMEVTP
jgi:hypothetical protein